MLSCEKTAPRPTRSLASSSGIAGKLDNLPSVTALRNRCLMRRPEEIKSRSREADALAFIAMDPTNRNTALASAMAEELARCGVRRAVVSPGSRSTPLALALWREPAIEVTVVVDERSAGFFALGSALPGR